MAITSEPFSVSGLAVDAGGRARHGWSWMFSRKDLSILEPF
jgi:hypothetical protein